MKICLFSLLLFTFSILFIYSVSQSEFEDGDLILTKKYVSAICIWQYTIVPKAMWKLNENFANIYIFRNIDKTFWREYCCLWILSDNSIFMKGTPELRLCAWFEHYFVSDGSCVCMFVWHCGCMCVMDGCVSSQAAKVLRMCNINKYVSKWTWERVSGKVRRKFWDRRDSKHDFFSESFLLCQTFGSGRLYFMIRL